MGLEGLNWIYLAKNRNSDLLLFSTVIWVNKPSSFINVGNVSCLPMKKAVLHKCRQLLVLAEIQPRVSYRWNCVLVEAVWLLTPMDSKCILLSVNNMHIYFITHELEEKTLND
jgi:hypothetical protein